MRKRLDMGIRTRRLLETPVMPTLARMAAPNVLAMMVQTSIGLIETYFVAGLGTDALASVALGFPVMMLVQMLSAGGMGGGIQSAVSRHSERSVRRMQGCWHGTRRPSPSASGSPRASSP